MVTPNCEAVAVWIPPGLPEMTEDEGAAFEALAGRKARPGRIERELADDVAEKMRAVDTPVFARGIAVHEPRALARGNEQCDARGFRAR